MTYFKMQLLLNSLSYSKIVMYCLHFPCFGRIGEINIYIIMMKYSLFTIPSQFNKGLFNKLESIISLVLKPHIYM
jgi:hypothetical protein